MPDTGAGEIVNWNGNGLMQLDQLSTGLNVFGKLFGGLTAFNGDNAQAKAEEYAAQEAGAQGGVNAQLALQRGDQVAAQGAVQAAANGGGFTGSALNVISNLSQQAEFNARAETYRANSEIRNDLYQAKVDHANGLDSLIGGFMGAGGAAAGGLANQAFQQQELKSLSILRGTGQATPYDFMLG